MGLNEHEAPNARGDVGLATQLTVALFANGEQGMLVFDPASEVILDVNEAAARLLGALRSQLVGEPLGRIAPCEVIDLGRRVTARGSTVGALPRPAAWRARDGRAVRLVASAHHLACAGTSRVLVKLDAVVQAIADTRSGHWEVEGHPRGAPRATADGSCDTPRHAAAPPSLLARARSSTGGDDAGVAALIGASGVFLTFLERADAVARTHAPVLIEGETGTGKELIARRIHAMSAVWRGPFVAVNCASVSAELFESEFFGHLRGAFTGAVRDAVGRFELANGGTLLLDEIGDMPLAHQGKLLRALDSGTFERVGDPTPRSAHVRIVGATNRHMREQVAAGRFREDLYYRISAVTLRVPALRERGDDALVLADHFSAVCAERNGRPVRPLSADSRRRLRLYQWPGNVRELRNAVERGVALSTGDLVELDLDQWSGLAVEQAAPELGDTVLDERTRRDRDRENIEAALRRAGGRIAGRDGAAAMLGIPAGTLASRMKALGIRRSAFVGDAP